MTGRVSTSDLALAHFVVADCLRAESEIQRTSTLHFITKQLNQKLKDKSPAYRGAFVAYWINKRRPFSRVNLATATTVGLAFTGEETNTDKLGELASALSANAKIDQLCAIIDQ